VYAVRTAASPADRRVDGRAELRVTFVTRYFGRARGGIGRYEEALLPALRPFCDVAVRPIEPLPIPRLLVRACGLTGRDLEGLLHGHPLHVPHVRPGDVVHLTNQTLAGNLLWQRHRGPTVVTVHDIIPIVAAGRPWSDGDVRGLDLMLQQQWFRALRRADLLVADSEATRSDLARRLGVPADGVRVVPLAVDHRAFTPEPSDDDSVLAQLGVPTEGRYLLYAGSLHPRKNVGALLEALRILRAEVPGIRLVLTGAPRTRAASVTERALFADIERLRAEGILQTLGHVRESDLPALYRRAAAAIVPSWYEGFGLPALEAMACGCPTVVSRASSLPEVVGDAGLLFDPRSPPDLARLLARVLTDRRLVEDLRGRGRQRAAQYTWERTARETVDAYREATMRRARGRG
jgi:glycosyltransferase involved in cell wall biosynthesis